MAIANATRNPARCWINVHPQGRGPATQLRSVPFARPVSGSFGCGDPAACARSRTHHALPARYYATTGSLPLLEPDTRLLSENKLWQLAFDVVSGYDGVLH